MLYALIVTEKERIAGQVYTDYRLVRVQDLDPLDFRPRIPQNYICGIVILWGMHEEKSKQC